MPCYPYNPHINEFKISEMLFETFNIQKLLLSVIEYPLLEFYLGGIGSTGILVDCGGGVLLVFYDLKLDYRAGLYQTLFPLFTV